MLKLYHCKDSRSIRPLWTLLEMGVPHELISLPFPPRRLANSYLEINPLGTVPCLDVSGVRMTESVAICQYLVSCFGPTELALDPQEADYPLYLDWLARSDATLTFPQTLVLRYARLEPPERRSEQVAGDYRRWFQSRLGILDDALGSRDHLCSGRFTIADICVGYALHLATLIGLTDLLSPAIQDYYRRLAARPAFVQAAAA